MGLTILSSIEATQAFAESWATELVGGEIFALRGVLGAGKTQLVKGLARGLGFAGDVTSPTFTIIHEYRGGRLPISARSFATSTMPRPITRLTETFVIQTVTARVAVTRTSTLPVDPTRRRRPRCKSAPSAPPDVP